MSAVLSIILIVIAAVAAFFIGRWHGLSTGTKELSEELESKDKELNELKSGVNEHFDETARLFSNLTEEYKTLYQHLATGANKLSDQDFKLKLSAPVGADALPTDNTVSEARATEVIDSEEHLAAEKSAAKETGEHEEASFIRNNSEQSSTDDPQNSDHDSTETEIDSQAEVKPAPDIDVEVSPPKDWADDDMDDDYHPNDSRAGESQFSDLADEEVKKPSAPGYEKKGNEKTSKESTKESEEAITDTIKENTKEKAKN
jgi:uncharacterized membrane-anchored protein YhcB (DUF1043 family)